MDSRILEQQEIDFVGAFSSPLGCEGEPFEGPIRRASEASPLSSTYLAPLRRESAETEDERVTANSLEPSWHGLSSWSQSWAKRIFDCACVALAMPVLVPLMLIVGAAVRCTSRGPVLFLQDRMGRNGRTFRIIKFRTMEHLPDAKHHPITTADNQRFTIIGPLLRRWKLDELPQTVNVLLGDMSLVGPRPKLPEHVISDLPCRPGITGMATLLFASEETVLACVPKDRLKEYYHSLVLPMKQQLDADYMACATLLSDLRILVNSILRRWGGSAFDNAILASTISTTTRTHGKSFKKARPNELPTPSGLEYLADMIRGAGFSAD